MLAAAVRETGTPLVVATVYADAAPARELRAAGVPVFREIASAVAAVSALAVVAEDAATGVPDLPPPDAPLAGGPDYWAAREALAAAGLTFMPGRLVRDAGEAVAAARELGFPVAVKALGLLHKSDAGGVALDLRDESAVAAAARRHGAAPAPARLRGRADGARAAAWSSSPAAAGRPPAGRWRWSAPAACYAEVFGDTRTALAPVGEAAAAGLIGRLRVAALLRRRPGRAAARRAPRPRPRRRA